MELAGGWSGDVKMPDLIIYCQRLAGLVLDPMLSPAIGLECGSASYQRR